jgi:hypothetical protein
MWRRWLAVIFVAGLVIAIVAVDEIFSLATESQPHGASRAYNQSQPVYASLVQLLSGGWNWLRDRVDRDTLTSIFIGVTAIFTGTLWWSTRQLWRSSEGHAKHMAASAAEAVRAANAMENVARHIAVSAKAATESGASIRERTAQQMRAYLSVIIGAATYQETGKDIRFEARPAVVNTGQTPAHQVTHVIRAAIMPLPFPPLGFDFFLPAQENQVGPVIGPRQDRSLIAIVDTFVLDAYVERIKQGAGFALAVWGTINYVDVFGEAHFTNFCQVLTWRPNNSVLGYYIAEHNDSD